MGSHVVFWILGAFLVVALVLVPILLARAGRRARQGLQQQREKNETLFRSMFPELQPYFHPERLIEFVPARLRRGSAATHARWDDPDGFPEAAAADLSRDGERDRVRLLDAGGALLREFTFEKHPEGGALRLAGGKLTVDLRKPEDPRVRYWHPEREFKWSRAGWIFKTPVADTPFATSNASSVTPDDFSVSSPQAIGFAGLGGAFDGGGASGRWEDAPAGATAISADGTAVAGSSLASAGDASNDSSIDSPGDFSSDSSSDSSSTSY